ncbi:MAG: MaoC/PaaZ C-terminal domain-containing protein [Acidimicrobiia bacterium]
MTAFNLEGLNKKTDTSTFAFDPNACIEYAKATNDDIAQHLSGELIPPIYCVVPVWEKVFEVVSNVVPEEHFFSVVHGEQDMRFYKPLLTSLVLNSSAEGICVSVKDSGTTLVVKTQSHDEETGDLVVEQYFTMFFRGVNGENSYGTPHDIGIDVEHYNQLINGELPGEQVGRIESKMDDDQTFRYAHASGDFMPIHIDDDFAKSVGLPGIIIHGLCTMAVASWGAIKQVADGDPANLKRIAVRFAKPLRPGEVVESTFYEGNTQPYFESVNSYYFVSKRKPDDTVILANSLVEVKKSS